MQKEKALKDEEKKPEIRLEKWWRYRKWSAAILLIVLVAVGALVAMNTQTVSYDFYVGVVTKEHLSQETLDDLQQRLDKAAWDRNHDNAARVLVWDYAVNWNSDGNASTEQSELDRLEADIGSKMSGLFLVDDPDGMPIETDAVSIPGTNLYAMLPPGHIEAKTYGELLENLIR